MRKIYIVRHCEAEGQPPEARLTENGFAQSLDLAEFFKDINVERIISSPYKRAVQSIKPLSEKFGIEIEFDNRLTERVLSTSILENWFDKLRLTFDDLNLAFEGGESSKEAMNRIVEVVDEIMNGNSTSAIIVTHGNLMSLLLKYFNQDFGFEEWKALSNPDVYLLTQENNLIRFERLWNE